MTKQSLYKGMIKDAKVYVTPPKDGKAEIHNVPSKSVAGKTYVLRIMPDGEVRCGCPFFVFSGKICSHLERFTNVCKPVEKEVKPTQEKPKSTQKDVQVRFEGKPSAKDMAVVDDLLNSKRVVPF